jgi:hypothetical protein
MRFALRRTPERLDADTERVRCLWQKMRDADACIATGKHLAELERRLRHLESRRAMYDVPRWRRILPVAREVLSGRYPLYSRGLKSALLDLVARGRVSAGPDVPRPAGAAAARREDSNPS